MTGAGHTIDEMVFENRNREYGSYQLRKKYPLRLAIGFSASLLFVILISLGYFFFLKEAGDETIYMIQGDSPYLKTVQTSLLSQEEIDAYSGGKEKTEEPVEIPAEKPSANPVRNFIVSEEAISDTFTAVDEKPDVADEDLDAGYLVNDSTAFGGFLSGLGHGQGGRFDRIPEFTGGNPTKYVEMNLRYPAVAMKQKIHGTVIISFIINKTGHVTDVKVEKGINPILDAEAVKTIKNMPAWKPAMINGKPVNFILLMPIYFVPVG